MLLFCRAFHPHTHKILKDDHASRRFALGRCPVYPKLQHNFRNRNNESYFYYKLFVFDCFREIFPYLIPINHIPPSGDVVRSAVLIFKIVSVLPDV